MNKRTVALIVSVILGLSAFVLPLVAYASDTAQMDVSYTIEPPPAPAPSGTYIVHIPSSINVNNESIAYITWTDYDIGSNQKVSVWIDGSKTFSDDGNFYLYHTEEHLKDYRILGSIERGTPTLPLSQDEKISGTSDILVAEFRNGSAPPALFGRLYLNYSYPLSNPAGTYMGTIYFKIELTTV